MKMKRIQAHFPRRLETFLLLVCYSYSGMDLAPFQHTPLGPQFCIEYGYVALPYKAPTFGVTPH